MSAGNVRRVWAFVCIAAVVFTAGVVTTTEAAVMSRIASTKHNLSTTGSGSVKAQTETQICVFCHTPHGASATVRPLWNRLTNAAGTYTKYTSSSLNATTILDGLNGTTSGSSLLCLSCHDGTIAIGNIMVANGRAFSTASSADDIVMSGAASGVMPFGRSAANANHGYTRRLGTDLRNDHPISITYDNGLAIADGEMQNLDAGQRYPAGTGTTIGIRTTGYKPSLPLEPTGTAGAGQVQCGTCHDPHLFDDGDPTRKFLRLNRYQMAAPLAGSFSATNDIICLACHTKLDAAWKNSAHATTTAANETYKSAPAATREFKSNIAVWEASCLNCHDTHTVQGARRLLREGTSDTLSGTYAGGGYKVGATTNINSAIEQTCYQCHTVAASSVISVTTPMTATAGVPDIESEFTTRAVRMPIITGDQGGGVSPPGSEVHDITDSDFIETPVLLGLGATVNRHVECTDCHNTHRVLKNELFNGMGSMVQRTHVAGGTAANLGADGNIASGALRGSWGVQPSYSVTTSTIWMSAAEEPTLTVKKGNPGNNTSTARTETYLTREYQLCFKCHSNYSNTDGSYPVLRGALYGGTASGVNGVTRYTNVAREFAVRATDPPTSGTDQGEGTNVSTVCAGGDCIPTGPTWDVNTPLASTLNHRSWHPVIFPTGRDGLERGSASFDNIRPPFNVAARIGKQTMHCSDCHGQATSWTDGTGPNLAQVQGPHGSSNSFLLKGAWGNTTLSNLTANTTELCANCHLAQGAVNSAWGDSPPPSSHDAGGNMSGAYCVRCHIAVPHGWKNKAFLVNKRCVGTEGAPTSAGPAYTTNCNAIAFAFDSDLTWPPYYFRARLYFATWRRARDPDYDLETGTCSGSGDMTGCPIP